MDRRRAAGTLLALAVCISCSAAAPTASNNQTALDVYDGPSEGCYYNFQSYSEGDRIMTNEPCLNCTCHNRMLMCYLRVCPFTKPIGQDCTVEKRADQCCPIVTCPDVPVDLLTSTSTTSPAEYGNTGIGRVDKYGCEINGKYFPEGAKVQSSPNKPCEHCYCIRNMTTCVMQECTLHVEGCTPIYNKDVCCPVRYSCDHPEDEIPLLDDMTTTVRPTPGFLLTTTTLAPVTQSSQECVHDDQIFPDGALIKTEKACEHCYCMKGDIVCVVQECGTPMENEGKNCTSVAPREGQCCPDTYICEGDDQTTEVPYEATTLYEPDEATTTPPRRVGIEGSGYRNEDETPTIEPDVEGSGEEPAIDIITKTEAPEKETEIIDDGFLITKTPHHSSTSTATQEPEVSSEPDKGLNTVPDVAPQEEFTKSPFTNKASETEEETKLTTTPIYQAIPEQQATTESSLLETTNILPLEESATTHLSSVPEAENIATELPVTTGKSEPETGTTYKPLLDTTTMNVVENEIDEGTNLYPSPGRIPGEGDCLLNGITYNNESSVPSSSKCHSSCKCISSIIKCEPILCSPPPEYMDNCQPIYDSPESCCPTYICDHSKETIPPQPHSQMTETVSSTTTPDCDDDQCKKNVVQPSECSGNDCQVTLKETSQGPVECSGTECKLTTQEIPPKEPNLNECTDEECKIAMKIPLDSAVSEKEPSSVTEQSDIATNDCSGDNCGEKVFEKEPSSVTESPESTVLPDKELSPTKLPDLIPTEVPDKESSVTTELFKPVDTSDKEPIPEIKPENEVKEPTATESSEATSELPDKKLTESECTGDDCKALEKESAAATTEASITPVKELTGSTESSLDVETPAGECNGADCKDIEKEMPASTESSDTLNKEQLATTVSPLSEDKETDKCSGDGCKEIEKESTVPTESSEASTMANIEPSTSTEHKIPEDLLTSECNGDDCKVIEKEPSMPSEPSEIPHEDSPTTTELSLPAEIPTSECNGQDCQVPEKEASGSSEPTPTSKTEIANVTEPTAQCDGDGCQIIEKEPAGVTEPADVFEKEPSASTEPAVLAETTATDCNGDDCSVIKNEPSSSITTESPAVPSECIGDACAIKEEEPSAATETSPETPEKDFAATEPSIVQETTFKEPSIGTEPSEAPQEPLATTEPTVLEEKPNKELSSATESSLPEETPEQKPSDVTEHPEILEIDRLPTTEPSKLYQESEKEPSSTTEVSSLGDLPNTEAPNQNPDIIDTSKPSEEPEKELSPTTESSDKDLSFVSTPETTPSSEKDMIHTTESSEQSNAESPSVTVSPQIPETVTKLAETTELSSPAETSDKEMPMATESSIPTDTSDKQSTPTEPTPGKDESIITEPEKSTELADKETNAVTEAAQQPDIECDGTDCKVIGKEPVSPVESTSPDSISITESSTELSSPTSELPEIAECSGEDCKAIETDSTTQSTGDAQVPEKQAQPTATEESNISEKEPSIVTETAVPAVECSDGNCKLDDNKSPAATESSLSTNLPEENPNIIRESTLPTGISEEPSAMTETAQPEIATNGECSGIDCKVIELESATVSSPSTDLSKTESPAISEPTTKPKLECSGDDCKLDEKESGATEPTALDQTLSIEKEPTEPSISENEEPSAQPEPTSDKKPESDCNSDECKATEYEPKPSEDENCKGEGCETADKTQSVSTELPLLSATQPEGACIGDQCQTTGKENLPTTEQPDAIATKEPAVLSESTPTSECIGDDCKSNEKESAPTEIPLDTIETECNNDNCRRKQTEEVSSGTISSSSEGVNTESATVEPVTEAVSLPDENKATEATEVTTVEIMSQDTSSTPVTEIKDEEQKTEKQPEGVTQTQDSLTASTEKLPSEKETETKPSIDEVLQEQTTQSSLASQEPTESAETSTSKPETESETEIPEEQKPVTETMETSSQSSNIPDGESITEGATTPEKDLSQITEKQEILSAEMTTSSPIYDKESENPTTYKEHFTTTIRSEMIETDKTDKPDYHDTEPEKTDNTQFETETESSVEKTTLNADRRITNPVTESLPEQGLTDSDRIAESDKEEPIPTEAVSVVTSPTATNEVEHVITENPEDTMQSITTIAPMLVENEETTLADKVKPEYPQTEAPEFNAATTKSTEHSDQTTVSISEENLDNQEAVTTEINVTPELVTKAPESIATESQVKDSESSQYPEDKLSTTSERISPTEIYTTAASEAPEVTSSSTEPPKQTLPDSHVADAHSTIAEDTILEGSTAQTPTHIEPVSSSQPDLQDITEANKDENELKLEEPTTQSIEAEQTTEPKVAFSETTPYQVELELHTHKTPEETSNPADFEASTAFVLTDQSKEPESSTAQDIDHTAEDILKTTEKTDNIIEQQTDKIPLEMPETSSASPDETESKQTDTPVISTMAYDNKYGLGADEKATEAPEEQQTEQPVKSEQATQTNLSEESVSPVTEKVSTEKVEDLPIPTTTQAEKVEEKPIETSTSKPVEMPIDETSEEDGQLPSGPGYGQEPDYVEEDQAFGPGTCRYGGKVYVSAQQIPRDDPCDFCFCFRSDIICLQQSCPPPIHGCHEEPIQGFCCPRYECPVSMATTLNVTTTTTTTTTTLPPHFLPHAYKGAAQRKGCVIKGHTYKVGEVVRASSGPCLHCTCGGDGQMKCDPKVCTPEPMLRQMIAAAVSSKRRR